MFERGCQDVLVGNYGFCHGLWGEDMRDTCAQGVLVRLFVESRRNLICLTQRDILEVKRVVNHM